MSHEFQPSLTIIRDVLDHAYPSGRFIAIPVDRWQLAKTRFRAVAADEREFGFELEHPLAHGDIVWENDYGYYVIQQIPEPVIVITSHEITQTAALAWSIGNLHQPLQINGHELIAADDPGIRQLCQHQQVAFETAHRVFQPFRSVISHHHHH